MCCPCLGVRQAKLALQIANREVLDHFSNSLKYLFAHRHPQMSSEFGWVGELSFFDSFSRSNSSKFTTLFLDCIDDFVVPADWDLAAGWVIDLGILEPISQLLGLAAGELVLDIAASPTPLCCHFGGIGLQD